MNYRACLQSRFFRSKIKLELGRYMGGPSLKIGPRREKTCLRGFANNTGADQPAHPQSDQRLCY